MKLSYLIATAISLLSLQAAVIAKDTSTGAIDDRKIKLSFEKKLGQLKDDNKTPETSVILKQLKERKRHEYELPQLPLLNGARSTAEVYSQRRSSVLCFGHIYKCDNCNAWHGNIAGGFIISEDGLAVTNYHVMEMSKAGAFGAMTADGEIHMVEEVLAASKRDDLAIVRLAGNGFTPTPLKPNAKVGSKVISISHPAGRFYTVSEGIISRNYYQRTRKGTGPQRIAITADFAKGSSGSPVFSEDGGVIGVITSTDSIYYDKDSKGVEQNLQMVIKTCIPSQAVLELLAKVEEQESDVAEEESEDEPTEETTPDEA